jgi:hypothetical protein
MGFSVRDPYISGQMDLTGDSYPLVSELHLPWIESTETMVLVVLVSISYMLRIDQLDLIPPPLPALLIAWPPDTTAAAPPLLPPLRIA